MSNPMLVQPTFKCREKKRGRVGGVGLGWKHATVVLLYSSTHFLLPPPLPRPIAREGILEIRTSCMEIELGAEERKGKKIPAGGGGAQQQKRGTIRTAPFDMMEELHHMRESGSPRLSDLYLTAVALRVSRKSGGIPRFLPLLPTRLVEK